MLNLKDSHLKLIEFDKNLLNVEPTFTQKDLDILKEIHDVTTNDEEKENQVDESDNGQTMSMVIGGAITLGVLIVLYGLYKLLTKKKVSSKKKN